MNDQQTDPDSATNSVANNKISRLISALAFVILIIVILFLTYYSYYQDDHPSTDDAFVQAHIIKVNALISAKVVNVFVNNHQPVKKGDLLFQLDDYRFQLNLTKANAELTIAQQNLTAAQAKIKAATGEVNRIKIEMALVQENAARIDTLVKRGQAAKTNAEEANTKLQETQQQLQIAENNLQALTNESGELNTDNAAVKIAKMAVKAAELELSYSQIRAPFSGIISNIQVHQGDTVAIGEPLCALIDTQNWWITANFPETILGNIKLNQSAKIVLDMYPNQIFHGIVSAIGKSSTSTFSLLPAQNSSGNWIKIKQRFPVTIQLSTQDKDTELLRVGASATVTLE